MAIEQYPRKSVARPHTEINVDTSGIGGSSSGSEKILMLVGSAKGGKPNEVYRVRNYPQAKSIFRSGDLLDAIELAWNPSPDVPGAGDILAMRVDEAKNSSLTKGALKFTSELYGTESKEIQVALEDNELTKTKRLRLVFSKDRYNKVFDNLGKIFSINYTGEEEAATFTIEEDSVTKNANKLILKAGTSGALVTVREYELGSGAFTDANVLISDINNLPDFEAKFFPIGDKNVPTATFEKEADVNIKNKKDAFEKITGYKVYVDNNSHLTGALGVAILSRAEEEIDFSFDIEDIIFETKGTECKGCSNNCEIIKVMRDNKIIDSWGNRCPRGELVHK